MQIERTGISAISRVGGGGGAVPPSLLVFSFFLLLAPAAPCPARGRMNGKTPPGPAGLFLSVIIDFVNCALLAHLTTTTTHT